jgi:uncharacterized protein YegP (UPF0339 family)
MTTWIFLGTTILFFTLWISKRRKKVEPKIVDIGLEKALSNTQKENTELKASIQKMKTEIQAKELELHGLNSELELCRQSKAEVDVTPRPELIFECIDDEKSSDMSVRKSFFEVFMDAKGHYRWRFKAKNNKIVADSGEGYTTKQNLKKGIAAFLSAIKEEDYNVRWNK